jgi:hypothetical protein
MKWEGMFWGEEGDWDVFKGCKAFVFVQLQPWLFMTDDREAFAFVKQISVQCLAYFDYVVVDHGEARKDKTRLDVSAAC